MSDFDLQIFGGVTAIPAWRAFPPRGTAGDLCAKDVLYAMKTRKNHAKNAKNSPRAVFSPVLNYPRRRPCKNVSQPAKMDARPQPARRTFRPGRASPGEKRNARDGGKGMRQGYATINNNWQQFATIDNNYPPRAKKYFSFFVEKVL